MSNSKLFKDFPPISSKEWREKIEADLKGADFDKKLVWKTIEGFNLQPYYRAEDNEKNRLTNISANEFPYIRGQKTEGNNWLIRQDFKVDDIDQTNKAVFDALMKGVTSVNFRIEKNILNSQSDFDRLMRGIELSAVEINFYSTDSDSDIISMMANYIEKNNIKDAKGSFNIDPLAWQTVDGTCKHDDYQLALQSISELILFAKEKLPNFHVLSINSCIFPNAGSSIVQELAFGLSMANEYLSNLSDTVDIDTLAKHTRFNIGISSNFFMEIAKVRALRYLWSKLIEAYKPKDLSNSKLFIHAQNASWNKTIFDAHVNMLRSTTESMSAVIGGIDSLTVNPFDETYKESDAFSQRISRNTQILLKEEAYLDKVADPSAGSYYVEELTSSIIDKAWERFLEVDAKGGYYNCIKEGFIQEQVEEMAQKRDQNIAQRKEILLGTNQYPNTLEKAADKIETKPNNKQNSDIKPLKIYRGAEAFEQLRLSVEKLEKQPKAFLFTYGNVAMRRARAQFAENFFGCSAYQILDNNGFESIEEGIAKAKEIKPEVVVLCSADEEYINMMSQIQSELGKDSIIVVAGNPKDKEALKEAGASYFIHAKSNVLETLESVNTKLKIKK